MNRKLLSFLSIVLIVTTACSALLSDASKPEAEVFTSVPPAQPQPTAAAMADAQEKPQDGETAADNSAVMEADRGGGGPDISLSQSVGVVDKDVPEDMFFEDYGTNPILDTEDDHLSTFAMDVDSASYTIARSYLMDYDQFPPTDAIRPEEFINYFDADYPGPEDEAFAIHLDAAPAPFGYEDYYLLRVGLQGRYIESEDRSPSLLIFVIDVSGSMDRGDRLGLVKQALELLVGELREDDRVGIVVYSDNSRVLLEPTPASDTSQILSAINALRPEGSTNAAEGLRLGYNMAQKDIREGTLTRVILLSDGVANTGPEIEASGILNLIEEGVESGITLSTVGFGMGNYNDVLMEQLANDGNGNYYYVDTLREARRIFVHNLTGTLQVIAYNAKVQVDFNPEVTDRYRLIGYENRAVADEDFRDDTVDAGEVGAGHSVTALYEIALEDTSGGTVATVQIRYEDADTREVVEISKDIMVEELLDDIDAAPASFRLHAAVAEFSELLRQSYWAEDGNYVDLLMFAKPLEETMADNEEVMEFLALVRTAGRLADE